MSPTITRAIPLEEIIRGLKLNAPAGVSAELAHKIAEHNEDAAKVFASVESLAEAIQDALDNITDADNASSLAGAVDVNRFTRVEAAQAAAQLWKQRGELAERVLDELRERIKPADQQLATATEATRAGLEGLGISESTMIAGGWNSDGVRNATAAAAQLRHIVGTALPVREAYRAAHDAKNAVSAAMQQIAVSEAGLTKALKAVRSIAEKSVAQMA